VLAIGCGVASDADPAQRSGEPTTATVESAASARYDWLQYNGNAQHSGNNTLETGLGRTNVASLVRKFQVTLPSVADGAPVYLASANTATGVRDVVFVTTKDGRILALDGQTGATLWSKQFGPGTCKINNGSSVCFTTSSPAIDPGRAFVYSYGLDGKVHKLAVADGTETTTGGWPQVSSLKGFDDKGSSPLLLVTARSGANYLYIAHGGYPGDHGDYQGHITVINLSSGAQKVFNTLCSDQAVHFQETPGTPDCVSRQSAVWARAGVVYDSTLDRIFIVTGNGNYSPSAHSWGDSILALSPDGSGTGGGPFDSYTPTNFQALQDADADLGSTAPAILPVPAGSSVARLGLQSGKDAKLRLVNLSNLSGAGGPGHTGGEVGPILNVPQGGGVFSTPAVWVNPADNTTWAFVANGSGISALKVSLGTGGVPQLTVVWQKTGGGFSPLVANNVLYYAGSNALRALDPTTGNPLWSDTTIGSIHWQSPMVANGVLYVTDGSSHLTAYSAPTVAKFSVKINFQPAGAPVPSGYFADAGAVFADRGNGFSYGWDVDNSAQTRDRNATNSPDQRYDTLIHLQKPENPNARWDLAVPSGTYTVRTVSGDPGNIDSVYRLNAEATLALNGTPTASSLWFDQTITVAVTDGRLTISNASGSQNNKIDFIEVTQQ
jgi:outer membrane protein assembly factor BamB